MLCAIERLHIYQLTAATLSLGGECIAVSCLQTKLWEVEKTTLQCVYR